MPKCKIYLNITNFDINMMKQKINAEQINSQQTFNLYGKETAATSWSMDYYML